MRAPEPGGHRVPRSLALHKSCLELLANSISEDPGATARVAGDLTGGFCSAFTVLSHFLTHAAPREVPQPSCQDARVAER